MSGGTKYALVRMTRDISFVVDTTVKVYRQVIGIVSMELLFQSVVRRVLSFFIITVLNLFMQNSSHIFIKLHRECSALILWLVLTFYTVKHVLSAMTEIVSHYRIPTNIHFIRYFTTEQNYCRKV